jgi:hypothetical protein
MKRSEKIVCYFEIFAKRCSGFPLFILKISHYLNWMMTLPGENGT